LKPDDLKTRVARLLADEVGPMLHLDGGAIEVLAVREGVVQVRLHGACGGCPSTLVSVIHGIEQELRCRFPEIEYLEALP
jgi:Fe-S cluster biogenesis protein NfuA